MYYTIRLPRTRTYQAPSRVKTWDGKVVKATPAFKWAVGKEFTAVLSWVSDVEGSISVRDDAGRWLSLDAEE